MNRSSDSTPVGGQPDKTSRISPFIRRLYQRRPDEVAPLLNTFIEHTEASLKELDMRLRAQDVAGLSEAAHSLKGSCYVLGLSAMAEHCVALERVAQDQVAQDQVAGTQQPLEALGRPFHRELELELARVRADWSDWLGEG